MKVHAPWERRLEALGLLALSGAPTGFGIVAVVGNAIGVDGQRAWLGAVGGLVGAIGGALILAAWWVLSDGENHS